MAKTEISDLYHTRECLGILKEAGYTLSNGCYRENTDVWLYDIEGPNITADIVRVDLYVNARDRSVKAIERPAKRAKNIPQIIRKIFQ